MKNEYDCIDRYSAYKHGKIFALVNMFQIPSNTARTVTVDIKQFFNLNHIIIEVTNRCNLYCSTCLRGSWSEALGHMSKRILSKLINDLGEFPSPTNITFGGYGEPLSHPEILEMIRQLTDIGCPTAMITNGTLLTMDLVNSLVEAGLKKIWISVDNIHQQALASAVEDLHTSTLTHITEILRSRNGKLEELDPGLAMILTAENQTEVLDDIDQARKLGIRSFFITNLEAYSPAQAEELPYTLGQLRQPGSWLNAKSDFTEVLKTIQAADPGLSITGTLTNSSSICPFTERDDLVLRWDGEISPCLPLLYGRTIHIGSWEHVQFAYSLGSILKRSLIEIWRDREFVQLRERLRRIEFSPCLSCRDCWLSEDNLQDCMGYQHPTCGGCLWAAGLINCP